MGVVRPEMAGFPAAQPGNPIIFQYHHYYSNYNNHNHNHDRRYRSHGRPRAHSEDIFPSDNSSSKSRDSISDDASPGSLNKLNQKLYSQVKIMEFLENSKTNNVFKTLKQQRMGDRNIPKSQSR